MDPRFHEFARLRLRKFPNVILRQANSIDGLKALAAESVDRSGPIFFYLDAHWGCYLPLREELEIITSSFPKAVIMVDDFQVPDDPGYKFDNYGEANKLSINYVLAANTPKLATYFPTARSEFETGEKRGSVVMSADPGVAAVLDRLPSLQRWRGSHGPT